MLPVVEPRAKREHYLSLLLLIDESEAQVRSYPQEGDLYVLPAAAGTPLGVAPAALPMIVPEFPGPRLGR